MFFGLSFRFIFFFFLFLGNGLSLSVRSAPCFYVLVKVDALTNLHTAAHATHRATKDRKYTPAFELRFCLIVLFYVHFVIIIIPVLRWAGLAPFPFIFRRVARGSTSLFSYLFCITITPRNTTRSN